MINACLNSHRLLSLLYLWDASEYTERTHRKYRQPVQTDMTTPAVNQEGTL